MGMIGGMRVRNGGDEGAEWGARGNGAGWFGEIIRRNCRGITEERQGMIGGMRVRNGGHEGMGRVGLGR